MLKIKKIWTQVKLTSSKEKQQGRWRPALGGATEEEEEDDDEDEEKGREWRKHKQRVRQDYRRELSQIRRRDQEREVRRQQERREMERWQRKERARLTRALREQEAEPRRPPEETETTPHHRPWRQDGERLEAGLLSMLRPTWLRPGRNRVAPSESRQLNWFNSLDGEEAATLTRAAFPSPLELRKT